MEATLVAALFTPLPIVATAGSGLYVQRRSDPSSWGVAGGVLVAVVALATLGAFAGWVAAAAAGPTRAPLGVGFMAALSVYGGVVIGLMFGRVSLHSPTAAWVVSYLGGAIVGPLGFGEFAVYDRKLRDVSTSVAQARERGILLHDYAMRPKVVVASTPRSQQGAYVRIEEAWVEQVRRGRFLRSPEVTGEQRLVLRMRPIDEMVYVYILGADGKPEYLGRPRGRQEADSTLLTAIVRAVPAGPLRFLTLEEARAMR